MTKTFLSKTSVILKIWESQQHIQNFQKLLFFRTHFKIFGLFFQHAVLVYIFSSHIYIIRKKIYISSTWLKFQRIPQRLFQALRDLRNIHEQSPEVFYNEGTLKIFAKFIGREATASEHSWRHWEKN